MWSSYFPRESAGRYEVLFTIYEVRTMPCGVEAQGTTIAKKE